MATSTREVCTYRNLQHGKPTWSLAAVKGADNRGLVLGHADSYALTGARTMVKESRRAVIANGGHREVCAWFVGVPSPHLPLPPRAQLRKVTFRPHERSTFFTPDDGAELHAADVVYFTPDGQAWIQG
jgi:hypothetical protein